MLQKGGEADREGLGKLLHRRFALKQAGHDRAPGGIGERVEDGVERSWLVRHMVNYIAWFAVWQSFCALGKKRAARGRSEEHTSELQSLMRISYDVFCLKHKTTNAS